LGEQRIFSTVRTAKNGYGFNIHSMLPVEGTKIEILILYFLIFNH
jgi:hypothetical protein